MTSSFRELLKEDLLPPLSSGGPRSFFTDSCAISGLEAIVTVISIRSIWPKPANP